MYESQAECWLEMAEFTVPALDLPVPALTVKSDIDFDVSCMYLYALHKNL